MTNRAFVRAERDGFTVCLIDVSGFAHCFRIDPEMGEWLVQTLNAPLPLDPPLDAVRYRFLR